MSTWLERATRNLVALSVAQDFATAKREWDMTHGFNDRSRADGECGLCEHPNIRYEFEIANKRNENHLWVGSECIKQFIPVYLRGAELTDETEKGQYLERLAVSLRRQARRERAFETLDALANEDSRFNQPRWKHDWQLGYSVKQLQMIAIACRKRRIPFHAGSFRINTRRQRVLDQAYDLKEWQYRQLRPAFPETRRRELDQFFFPEQGAA